MKRILTGIISAGITIGVIAAWIIWSNSSFEETVYAMESYKIEETVRVIVLADLHQRSFGPDNETLLDRVRALRPDLLLIAGDLVNKGDPDWDYAVGLCRELAEIAPVYYAMGNHENEALYGQDLNKKFLDGAALGEDPENVPLLLELAQTEKGTNRDAVLEALAGQDGEVVAAFWAQELEKHSQSVRFLDSSNTDWAIQLVTSGLRQRLEKFLGGGNCPTYEEGTALTAWCWALGRKDSPVMLDFWRWADSHMEEIDQIITDRPPPEEWKKRLEDSKVQLLCRSEQAQA